MATMLIKALTSLGNIPDLLEKWKKRERDRERDSKIEREAVR